MASLRRRNDQRQDQYTNNDASTFTASTVQPKRRMKDQLKSDLNQDDGRASRCKDDVGINRIRSIEIYSYVRISKRFKDIWRSRISSS